MKIICDCGNEMDFIEDKEVMEDDSGKYVTTDFDRFRFWSEHDVVGIVCAKCEKSIWLFT